LLIDISFEDFSIRGAVKKSTDTSQKIAILRKIPFFRGVSDSDLKEISQKFYKNEFKKGEYLFWEGDPSSRLYVIKEGKVKILKHSSAGKEMLLEIVSAGEICGAGAIFSQTQVASAQTIEHVSTYSLSKKDFLLLLERHNKLAIQIIMYLGEKLMKAHEMMISLVSSKVDGRIAALLIGLSEKHGSLVPQGIRINLRLTRQDIADIVGTTVETAIRVMSRFRKQGMLITDSKHIVVIDKDKLKKILLS
jgi:CRP-like cAMP-binding protein